MDYHKGDKVPKDGVFRCIRCGNRYEFKEGNRFPACRCGHGAYRAEITEPVRGANKVTSRA